MKRSRLKVGGGSYLSSHDPSKCWELANEPKSTVSKSIGLGPAERVDVFTDVPINFYITIVEGAGIK